MLSQTAAIYDNSYPEPKPHNLVRLAHVSYRYTIPTYTYIYNTKLGSAVEK